MGKTLAALLLLTGLTLPAPCAAAGEMLVLRLEPEETSVDFVLDATMHTVTGHLGSADGRIAFDPESGLATGEVVIDLTGAESGIERRDRKMHRQVLETDRYPEAVFRVEEIDLPRSLRQGTNDVQLHGILELHGAEHPVSVLATATLEDRRIEAFGWLDVPYVDWGLTDPSFFVLRVGKTVRVEIELVGRLVGGELPD